MTWTVIGTTGALQPAQSFTDGSGKASAAWLLGNSVFHSAHPARISAAEPVFSSPGVRACVTPARVTVWLCAMNHPLPVVEAQAPAVALSGQVLASTRLVSVSAAASYVCAVANVVGGARLPVPHTWTE